MYFYSILFAFLLNLRCKITQFTQYSKTFSQKNNLISLNPLNLCHLKRTDSPAYSPPLTPATLNPPIHISRRYSIVHPFIIELLHLLSNWLILSLSIPIKFRTQHINSTLSFFVRSNNSHPSKACLSFFFSSLRMCE